MRKKIIKRFNVQKSVTVRHAGLADATGLDEMFRANATALARSFGRIQRVSKKQREWLREKLKATKRTNKITLVAEVDGKIVGWITGGKSDKSRLPFAPWWIHVLHVAKDYRRQGIGEQLVLLIIRKFREIFGATKIGLKTRCHNERAKRVYRRIGFSRVASESHRNKKTGRKGSWFIMVKK